MVTNICIKSRLANLVLNILSSGEDFSHSQLVQSLREEGYERKEQETTLEFSSRVHNIIKKLIRKNLVEKDIKTRIIRIRYS